MDAGFPRILSPDAVAIVGASTDPSKRGYQAIEMLQANDYPGSIYPVNPSADGTILGLPVYPAVTDIPERVDLAFVATPASVVPAVLEDCGAANVPGAVVIAAGFSEIGNDALEADIVSIAEDHNIRLIGPNINGIINVHDHLNLVGMDIPAGNIALVLQSGNIAVDLINEATLRGTPGFSYYLALGNQADVQLHEYLPYLDEDPNTNAIVVYAEGMPNGRQFLEQAQDIIETTPIVLLKGGRSTPGKQSARSHTASLVGDSDAIAEVCNYYGIPTVRRLDELLPAAETLANLPPATGPNIGILTDGGGHGTHVADALTDANLTVPTLSDATQRRLADRIPDAPNVTNPVDVLTAENDLAILADAAELLLADDRVDALFLTGIFGGYDVRFSDKNANDELPIAQRIAALPEEYEKPVIIQSTYAGFDSPTITYLRDAGIPVFKSVNVTTQCLASLTTHGDHLTTRHRKSTLESPVRSGDHPIVATALTKGHETLSEVQAKNLLQAYDAPVAPFEIAATPPQAVDAAAAFDGPVSMKLVSRDILHKTEAGGVALDVAGADAIKNTFTRLLGRGNEHDPDAEITGVMVSPMIEEGVELFVGVTTDEEIGPVLTFGLGGIFVEVIDSVTTRPIPLHPYDAETMIEDLPTSAVITGVRGHPPVDRAAIIDLLTTVSDLIVDNPSITDLDLNPVIGDPDGVTIIDAAVELAP